MKRSHYEIIIRTKREIVPLPAISLRELSRLCECQTQVVMRFVAAGLLEPAREGVEPLFSRSSVIRLRKALRLKRDLNLSFDAVALVMELLERIDELERKLSER